MLGLTSCAQQSSIGTQEAAPPSIPRPSICLELSLALFKLLHTLLCRNNPCLLLGSGRHQMPKHWITDDQSIWPAVRNLPQLFPSSSLSFEGEIYALGKTSRLSVDCHCSHSLLLHLCHAPVSPYLWPLSSSTHRRDTLNSPGGW